MSGSEDDWFEKDIDEFVVKSSISENVENISLSKKNTRTESDGSANEPPFNDYGGNYSFPKGKQFDKNDGGRSVNAHVQPMTFKKLCFVSEQTPIAAFLEVIHPESGFFECMSRKTNALETILTLSNVICKVFTLPFTENIKCLCTKIIGEENFWHQLEKHLKESTIALKKPKSKKKGQVPRNDAETWLCATQLCQSIANQKTRPRKSFLKNVVQLAENNQNIDLEIEPFLQQLKSIQEELLKLKEQVDHREIFPTLDELKSSDTELLNPNIVKGQYRDVAHYLGVHLALLREDFLSPLRDGVQQIMSTFAEDEEATSNFNVNVYPGVKIEIKEKDVPNRPGMTSECIVVDLEAKKREENSEIELGRYGNHKYAKRLMYGSLVCLTTSNQFEDLIVAIVSHRDNDLLNQGYIQIEIVQTYNITSFFDKEFIMCESDVYFETYRHVYEVLKRFNDQTFPLKNYIIDVDTTHAFPSYIPESGKTTYIYKNQPLDVKDTLKWPSAEALGLNESQLNAFKSSLTRKFSVVQGPPGCGKSFIGLEIVKTLLLNTDAQILIVCYTNHALDQFLAGILKCTEDIVRIGNQSKNELLDQFNLKQLNDNMIGDNLLKATMYNLRREYAIAIQDFTDLQIEMKNRSTDESLMKEFLEIQARLQSIPRRQEELKQIWHYHLIKSKRVIGMTSTGAARCHSLIQLLQTPIVIIEEAAEILEPHIVASLTTSVQHLVLIGDHQQLRPNSSVYKLAKLYKMDVSLFERMINNDIHCAKLTEQYRMRPEIANLIRPTIYNTLLDGASVQKYPSIIGTEKSLFFLTHTKPESGSNDETTKKNIHEASFLLALCNYLILQGYTAKDITILTTYNGQMSQLLNERKRYANLQKVRITVVDNFQGEDNKIILLSLVRSNKKNSIGYLAFKNRICVALSRAKEGLFIIGNMELLASQCKTWQEIRDELMRQEAIGDEMALICGTHQNITAVRKADNIDGLKNGGCHLPCGELLPCGHQCHNICHVKAIKHECDC